MSSHRAGAWQLSLRRSPNIVYRSHVGTPCNRSKAKLLIHHRASPCLVADQRAHYANKRPQMNRNSRLGAGEEESNMHILASIKDNMFLPPKAFEFHHHHHHHRLHLQSKHYSRNPYHSCFTIFPPFFILVKISTTTHNYGVLQPREVHDGREPTTSNRNPHAYCGDY